jgi:hypothetical protein
MSGVIGHDERTKEVLNKDLVKIIITSHFRLRLKISTVTTYIHWSQPKLPRHCTKAKLVELHSTTLLLCLTVRIIPSLIVQVIISG